MIMKRISIAACLFLVACGDGQDGSPATEPEPTAYEDMSFEQRSAFMTNVVLPQMKETFVAFDAKFETMTCATCHGSGATDGSFAMPSPDIPRLPATEEAFYEYIKDPEHGKWAQWMFDVVYPEMADLLQVPMYDPEKNPTGFSCSGCHMVEGQQ
jgi:cytochrome c553